MTEEIKEILNKLLEYFKESNINDFGYEKDKLISYEEAQILLNYITNLQKENGRIGGLYEAYEEANSLWIKKCEDYKQRNEKAIEYIKNRSFDEVSIGPFDNDFNCKENLLNILEGGDE